MVQKYKAMIYIFKNFSIRRDLMASRPHFAGWSMSKDSYKFLMAPSVVDDAEMQEPDIASEKI